MRRVTGLVLVGGAVSCFPWTADAALGDVCHIDTEEVTQAASDFVYPVGKAHGKPTQEVSSGNGFVVTQKYDNPAGHTGVDLADGSTGGEVRAIAGRSTGPHLHLELKK